MATRRLYRSRRERMLLGIAGGIAEYLDIDPTVVRVLWVLSVFFGGFSILLYVVLAFVVPLEPIAPASPPLAAAPPSALAAAAPPAPDAPASATGAPAGAAAPDVPETALAAPATAAAPDAPATEHRPEDDVR